MRGRGFLAVVFVVCLITPVIITPIQVPNTLIISDSSFCVAETEIEQMLLDVDLLEEPDYHIVGDSGEFSYNHSKSFDDDPGVSIMTWNHTANNTVTIDDGVYFKKSFDWPHTSEYPRSGFVTIDYAFNVSGDFDYSSTMRQYVYFSIWLESPSGDSFIVWGSGLSSSSSFDKETSDLWYTVGHAWDELVNDGSPDPSNTFNLCVGFFPGHDFLYADDGLEPWQLYSGSVTLLVKSLEVELTRGTPQDSDDVASPILENHWETSPANKVDFPTDYPPIFERHIDDSCRGIVILDDDSIVTLVRTYYNDGVIGFDDMVLQHWGARTNLLWYRRVLNYIPAAVATDGESIYVTGTRNGNPSLSKWSKDGNLVWNSTWNLGMKVYGLCLIVDSEGSSYLYLQRYNTTVFQPVDSYLIKVDTDGNEVWRKFLNQTWITEMYAGNNTSFYSREDSYGAVKEWDTNGNVVSTITETWFFRVDSDSLATLDIIREYDTNHPSGHWNIFQLNRTGLDGHTLWSTNLSIEHDSDYHENLFLCDMEIAPDRSILLLVYLDTYAHEYRLYRYFENGTLDCFKIIGWMPLMGIWRSYEMIPSSNGLVYLYAHEYQTVSPNPSNPQYVRFTDLFNKLEAYNYTDYLLPFNAMQFVPYIFAGAGIIILIGAIAIVRKKRIPSSHVM